VKAKILLVDDDPDLVRALRLRLRANNYEVATASDGYAAIASAQKERPSLIILDLGLPVGDGFVVLERLQNSDTLAGIPVIVLSARDPQSNEERALKAGAAAFFQKPADNDELLNVIRVSLGSGKAAAAPWPSRVTPESARRRFWRPPAWRRAGSGGWSCARAAPTWRAASRSASLANSSSDHAARRPPRSKRRCSGERPRQRDNCSRATA